MPGGSGDATLPVLGGEGAAGHTWGAGAADVQGVVQLGHRIAEDALSLPHCLLQDAKLLVQQLLLQALLLVALWGGREVWARGWGTVTPSPRVPFVGLEASIPCCKSHPDGCIGSRLAEPPKRSAPSPKPSEGRSTVPSPGACPAARRSPCWPCRPPGSAAAPSPGQGCAWRAARAPSRSLSASAAPSQPAGSPAGR